jgi:hypothetical protein
MSGELVVLNGQVGVQFPESSFLQNTDKPFEVHRCIVRLFPFNDATPTPAILTPVFVGAVPDLLSILQNYARVRIRDFSKNENLTKAAQLIGTLNKDNEMTWEFEDPYTLVRSEGFEVTCDNNLTTFVITVGAVTTNVGNLRFQVNFEGFLVVIAPASEQR